jgi:hypothetical protein
MRRLWGVVLVVLCWANCLRAEDFSDPMCAAESRWEAEAEVLVWWLRNGRIPPLLTTGPATSQGILDRPGTAVLYGNEKLDVNRHLGGRLGVTYWIDDCQSLGFQVGGFVIERNSRTHEVISDGSLLLARPFFDSAAGAFASEIIAGPAPGLGELSGSFYGFTKNELFGEQASIVAPLVRDGFELDLLVGPYFLQLRERLELTSASKLLPDEAVIFGVTDKYKIYNRFYGAHLGVQGKVWHGCWFLGFQGQGALGVTTQRINAFGDRIMATPTSRDWIPSGLLVQPVNAGKADHAVFDAVYELRLRAGCQLTSRLRIEGGYTLIGWTNPIRAGDQLDLARGPIPFADDHFWAQGASAGLELSW